MGASLKANAPLPAESFPLLLRVLEDPSAVSTRIEAVRIVAKAKLGQEQLLQLVPLLPTLSAVELREIVKIVRSSKDVEIGKAFAAALKDAPALGSLQESELRTTFSNYPPEVFAIVAPALSSFAAEDEARRRKLETLPALVAAKGRPAEGEKLFAAGKGACIACHRIGATGNLVGPNLSAIGAIRTERDLLESIFFPSNSLARDYETQAIATADGQSFLGVVRGNLPETIVIADPSGQERTLPRAQIVSMQTLPISLMPTGLDRTLTEQELLDLVAFLRSLKSPSRPEPDSK
jgi:putative heme-binding domain-containing protein